MLLPPTTLNEWMRWIERRISVQERRLTDHYDTDDSVVAGELDDWQWSMVGDAVPVDYAHREYNRSGFDRNIDLVVASCGAGGPVGADLIVNVRRDGSTELFSSGLAIPDGGTAHSAAPDVSIAWPDGSYLQVKVVQVGSTAPGSALTVQVVAA